MALQSQHTLPQNGRRPQNLWHKALETLDDDLKASLDFKKSTKHNILTAVLKTAEEKKQLCLKKRWKLNKSNGEVVILRMSLRRSSYGSIISKLSAMLRCNTIPVTPRCLGRACGSYYK